MNRSLRLQRMSGAMLTLMLASAVLFLFFHKHILEANQVSFASHGDGLHHTYGSLYHIEYDSSYWFFEGQNYPFGESVLFTGNQTLPVNLIKACKDLGWDFSGQTRGILNLLMLFSYVICALFLYLILVDFGLPAWYAVAGALLITFLTPQWYRMSGHYNLAYAHVLPVGLYLLQRFFRRRSFLISLVFGLFLLMVAARHLYFVLLLGVPWGITWLFMLVRFRQQGHAWLPVIGHIMLQMVLPLAIFMLFSASVNPATDRTAYPWGFFAVNTRWVSVFLPLLKPYGEFLIVGPVKTLGYVGMVSTVVFLLMLAGILRRWRRSGPGSALMISDRFMMNAFMAAGVVSLLMALGYPFVFWPELLNYTGPFRQFRAIGRLVIPFFYIMNIYALYQIWEWSRGTSRIRAGLLIAAVWIMMGVDAWFTVAPLRDRYYNQFERWNDTENQLPDNQWAVRHDWSEYQAIMPMPYYHVGSEVYWINGNSPIMEESYLLSLKTGLPLNSAMSPRVSISQTMASLDLYWEPGEGYPVLEDYDPDRAILLAVHRGGGLNPNELRLVSKARPIDSNSLIRFYRLHPDSLARIPQEHAAALAARARACLADTNPPWSVFESYDTLPDGRFSASARKHHRFFTCTFPDSGRYTLTFWFEGAGRDLWPRTNLFATLYDQAGENYLWDMTDFFRKVVQVEDDWGLVSLDIEARAPGDKLRMAYHNRLVTKGSMLIDRVLVQHAGQDVLRQEGDRWYLNNRRVIRDEYLRISP